MQALRATLFRKICYGRLSFSTRLARTNQYLVVNDRSDYIFLLLDLALNNNNLLNSTFRMTMTFSQISHNFSQKFLTEPVFTKSI